MIYVKNIEAKNFVKQTKGEGLMKRLLVIPLIALSFGLLNCQNKKVPVATSYSLKSIYFDYDRSLIRQDQTSAVQGNANYIKQKNVNVTIEGHCDERGTNEYNLALGQRRANAARDYVVNMGANPSRLRTVSYGEERPVCNQHDENCWWKNRRADFRK